MSKPVIAQTKTAQSPANSDAARCQCSNAGGNTDCPVHANTADPALVAGFDHPCKGSCSGWAQGRERGLFERAEEVQKWTTEAHKWHDTWLEVLRENKQLREALEKIITMNDYSEAEEVEQVARAALKLTETI